MDSKKIVIQIFTGSYQESKVNYQQIKDKLEPILKKISVEKVIMGWSVERKLYQRMEEFLHSYGVKLYLWLPVFSENSELRPTKLLMDDRGDYVQSYHTSRRENFEFYCPNSSLNVQNVMDIYEEYFQEIKFDGVFLDKMRYGSFPNGLTGIFSCLCPTCLARYESIGIRIRELKNEMRKVRIGQFGYEETPFKMRVYENGKYDFDHEVWPLFFREKARSISDACQVFADYFHGRGLQVGVDVFTPFLAYFVGQDIQELQAKVDFIKPTMYRLTNVPGALSFEYQQLLRKVIVRNRLDAAKKLPEILKVMGEDGQTADLNFVKKELNLLAEYSDKVYAGIEINRIPKIAWATPTYIKESLTGLYREDMKGFALSWDLMSMPEENINAVIEILENRE